MDKKIIVVAGNYEQVRYWIKHNIVPLTSKYDLDRLRGIEIGDVQYEGTYYEWFDAETEDLLHALKSRTKEDKVRA